MNWNLEILNWKFPTKKLNPKINIPFLQLPFLQLTCGVTDILEQ